MSLSELFTNNKIRYSFYILLAQGLFVLTSLYINYWINRTWNLEGFAIYNLVKRISSFIAFPLLVGSGIGIPRYISFLRGQVHSHSLEYLLSGVLIFICSFIAFAGFVFFFPSIILRAFDEPSVSGGRILGCVLIFVFSQGLYILLNSYYRGKIQFGRMSLLNILIMSLVPLLVLIWEDNVFTYFYSYALLTLGIVISIIIYSWWKIKTSRKRIQLKTIRLFKYGYPRIAADLGLFSLEFMPIFLISLYVGLTSSAYLAMAFILLKLASMVYEMVGSLVLPYFGKIFKNESSFFFISKVNDLLLVGILVSVIIAIIFYFIIPIIIGAFFPSLIKAILPTQLIFIAFPLFALYLLLRNILDIVINKAYNSINLIITFVIQLVVLALGLSLKNFIIYTVLSIVIPYFVLGLLTFWAWTRISRTLKQG